MQPIFFGPQALQASGSVEKQWYAKIIPESKWSGNLIPLLKSVMDSERWGYTLSTNMGWSKNGVTPHRENEDKQLDLDGLYFHTIPNVPRSKHRISWNYGHPSYWEPKHDGYRNPYWWGNDQPRMGPTPVPHLGSFSNQLGDGGGSHNLQLVRLGLAQVDQPPYRRVRLDPRWVPAVMFVDIPWTSINPYSTYVTMSLQNQLS